MIEGVGWAKIIGLGLAVVLLVPAIALAQGGPPLITDDPDTPGPGYWEINMASILEKSNIAARFEAPFADINYGVGKRIQLKFEIPWLTVWPSGKTLRNGIGDSTFGIKWRFLGQEGQRIAWSIYPQLEVNTAHSTVEKLVQEGRQLLLPTEFTVQLGPIELNGEFGRNLVQNGDHGWVYGFATEAELPRKLELLAEVHGERVGQAPTELIVDIGARQKISRQLVLLMSVGRAVHGLPQERPLLRVYIGLQFNLPGQYVFDPKPNHP